MGDDLTLLDERLRGTAAFALGFGLLLGALTVYIGRMQYETTLPWWWAVPLGLFAALSLYLVGYRNRRRLG